MKLVKCDNGHYYDAERYAQCPYCKDSGAASRYCRRCGKLFDTAIFELCPDCFPVEKQFCRCCGKELTVESPVCPNCGFKEEEQEAEVEYMGRKGKWVEDREHCPNCQKAAYEKTDRHCRFCGGKLGGLARYFVANPEYMECIYGPPPVDIDYKCAACGKSWTASNWTTHYYCPDCGGKVKGREKKGGFGRFGR